MALREVRQCVRGCSNRIRELHLHNCSHHADIHHDPTEGQADPVLAKVQCQAVREEPSSHTADREPDTMQTQLSLPFVAVTTVDPIVEEVTEDPS